MKKKKKIENDPINIEQMLVCGHIYNREVLAYSKLPEKKKIRIHYQAYTVTIKDTNYFQ